MTSTILNNDKIAIYSPIVVRITTLWAFSEAFFGGILHGLKVPFAGLLLSLIAAICITIIAIHSESKKQVISSTLVVIALKFILSPHTPPTAYFAVLLEGTFGAFLFWLQRENLRGTKIAAFVISVFCLMYSAFQHLLILTIVFGKSFWTAIDIFLNKITAIFVTSSQQYALYIVVGYLSCYLIAGILGGFLNIKIIQNIDNQTFNKYIKEKYLFEMPPQFAENQPILHSKKTKKRSFILVSILFIILLLSYLPIFSDTLMKDKMTEILVRGLLIIIFWNYFLASLLRNWITNWLEKIKHKKTENIEQVLTLFPDIKKIVLTSWFLVRNETFFNKYKNFFVLVFYLTIQMPSTENAQNTTPSVSA